MDELDIGQFCLFAASIMTALSDALFPCDGRLLKILDYEALYALIGPAYGGDGETTFALPNRPGPIPGLNYMICWLGRFSSAEDYLIGDVVSFAFPVYRLNDFYLSNFVPCDKTLLSIQDFTPLYAAIGSTYSPATANPDVSFGVPVLPVSQSVPAAATAYYGIAFDGAFPINGGASFYPPYISQIVLKAQTHNIGAGLLPCDGSTYRVAQYPALAKVIGTTFGGSTAQGSFAVPNVPAPVSGMGYYIAAQGISPEKS